MKDLVIITGGSGSWKTSLQNRLMEKYGYIKPANFTTREPRSEAELDDYVFLNKNTYLEKLWAWDFIWANRYNWNMYWTGLFDAEKVCIVLNPVGREDAIQQIASSWEYNITCIYLNITKKLQKERLQKRGDEPSDIKKRQKDLDYFAPNKGSLVYNWAEDTNSLADKIECEIKTKN